MYGKYLDVDLDYISELFLKFSHVMLQWLDYFFFCVVYIFYKATSKISIWYLQSAVY